MSKQTSQHEFPELGEDEEELDLPVQDDYIDPEDYIQDEDDYDASEDWHDMDPIEEYDEPADWDYPDSDLWGEY